MQRVRERETLPALTCASRRYLAAAPPWVKLKLMRWFRFFSLPGQRRVGLPVVKKQSQKNAGQSPTSAGSASLERLP